MQPRRRRVGSAEIGCAAGRAEQPNLVWSYDFLLDRTADGRQLKLMPVVDEYTPECRAIEVDRSITSTEELGMLSGLVDERGVLGYIRSDSGPESIAGAIKSWLAQAGVGTLYIEPGSPWQNGYSETFNSSLGDELLDRVFNDN